ncbi:beta-glucosidase [Curtobacterium sp. MCJR17_055]|uniref:glycoside hydrolase family 3 N-terminal domain-containing protein n=1 Tax=unclassified Curtobacterium TaxID=257496 RepID=UPI000D9D906F|nr:MULTISPECIES: glycoside hydrolase family 3 N-terminal domain-containing protein [unclassified Curtobacterium]PYY37870.1 beta-glucosidase [Curtobacterium sp. MCBD17_029]PYY56897.1 beta-glucosidase [Curtobacterium sp. MCJR17_055]PYY62188.1 beta-glucosidase [Curtobacterium sp. MCPF17_015]
MSTYPAPHLDPARPVDERIDDLLGRMSVEDKAGQLSQYFYLAGFGEPPADLDIDSLPPEHQAYLRQPKMVEDAIAAGHAGSVLFVTRADMANRLQKLAVETAPLGIPLLFGFDVIHGLRTIFPLPIAMAASWDEGTISASQAAAAREARAVGIHWTFAPMVDIARDARWGRIIEGAGEDPYLGAAVAAAQVRGFQGDLGSENVLAGPKHFVGYGAARGGRDYDDVEVSDSELHNVYMPPFRAAIEAGAQNVMSAYMDFNGVPASGNARLLTDLLRDDLGFDGFVVSDANAVKSMETQHFAASPTEAAVRAITSGLDMEMCTFDPAFSRLPDAVAQGLVSEDVLDTAVRRILAVKFALGLFEHPYVDAGASDAILSTEHHRELARVAAERTIVLLKNDGTLPLAASTAGSIAVIGQLAESKRDTLGPWVFAHGTDETVSILEGITARADGEVWFAPGAGIPSREFASMFDRSDPTVVNTPGDHDDDAEIDRAVAIAADADVAVVVVGERQNQIGENASRSTLDLPGRQLEQLQRIAATGTPVVLVVMSGRPLDLRWADENVPAILQAWYPGSRGGDAVADVVFGDVSPAGRLPFTWPRHVGHVPMVYSHLRTFQPEDQDKRYWDEESTPLYPFGHGLSYGSFTYDQLRTDRDKVARGDTATVSVQVTNASDRAADEVVQLYIHQRHGTSSRPVQELKGFRRLAFGPGETKTVTFTLGPDELRYWSAVTGGWVQDATVFDIWVGGSSRAALTTELIVV